MGLLFVAGFVRVPRLLGAPAEGPRERSAKRGWREKTKEDSVNDTARVMVVGGGIGGLTAAIALRRAGFEVAVFERASGFEAAGAGILLAANAVKALGELGLSDALEGIGVPASTGNVLSWRGEVLFELDASELEKRAGAGSSAVHRADLQGMLLRELDKAGGAVHVGKELDRFEHNDDGAQAFFADGTEERGDLLVGADGLRSRVRARLLGDEAPRYAGYTSWRGVASPGHELVPVGGGFESWGRGRRFGAAHVGGGRIYWFATKNAPEGESDGPAGSKAALLETFRGWHAPVEELIRATEEDAVLRTDVHDREPLGKRWGEGRATLLGDAAHPMTPNLGQGACQAVEDAVVLARCLRDGGADLAGSLRRYEGLRAGRTAAIVRRSRRVGTVGQLENPLLCRLRDRALKLVPARTQLRRMEQIAAYEVAGEDQGRHGRSGLVGDRTALASAAPPGARAVEAGRAADKDELLVDRKGEGRNADE